MRLVLRRGTVVEAGDAGGAEQSMVVDVDGDRRAAVADVSMVGSAEVGDEVVVNTQAVDLALGSGGFDIVHVNLTRGLGGAGVPGAHVMKLNYSSLQHAVETLEGGVLTVPLVAPVGVFSLHGQLAPVAWALGQALPTTRVGYVQTQGGALPASHSRVVSELLDRGLLAAHVTAGAAYGGRDGEAISVAGAIQHGIAELGWDIALCGPGPGILGSASALGHGGMFALDSAHAALALGAPVVLCARMSSSDPRERHRGLSHHTRTVLELLLAPVTVAVPSAEFEIGDPHETIVIDVDVFDYTSSGLPTTTMGRSIGEDPLFFAAALACGAALADRLAL